MVDRNSHSDVRLESYRSTSSDIRAVDNGTQNFNSDKIREESCRVERATREEVQHDLSILNPRKERENGNDNDKEAIEAQILGSSTHHPSGQMLEDDLFLLMTNSTTATTSYEKPPTYTISNSSRAIQYVQPTLTAGKAHSVNGAEKRAKSVDKSCCERPMRHGCLMCPVYCLTDCVVVEWKAFYDLLYVLGCRKPKEEELSRDIQSCDEKGIENPHVVTDECN